MILMLTFLTAPFTFALLYRMRGGLFNLPSTTLGRLIFVGPLVGAYYLLTQFNIYWAPVVFLFSFGAHAWIGHGLWMTAGNNPLSIDDISGPITRAIHRVFGAGTRLRDFLAMSFIGFVRHLGGLVLLSLGPIGLVYILGGLLHGAIYDFFVTRFESTEYAEWGVGALYGILLLIVFLGA